MLKRGILQYRTWLQPHYSKKRKKKKNIFDFNDHGYNLPSPLWSSGHFEFRPIYWLSGDSQISDQSRLGKFWNSWNWQNKVTTRWEGPQSLSYHKQWLAKMGYCIFKLVQANSHTQSMQDYACQWNGLQSLEMQTKWSPNSPWLTRVHFMVPWRS